MLVSEQQVCESDLPEGKPALLRIERRGSGASLTVTSLRNCNESISEVSYAEEGEAATLRVRLHRPDGALALCLCAHTMEFALEKIDENVSTIYFVQGDLVLGHVAAP